MLNVAEDENELNKKIRDLVDIAIKIFVGNPEGKEESQEAKPDGYVGANPSIAKPDVYYEENGKSIRKVLSTEFDEIFKSDGKYGGFKTDEIVKEE
jgi:hypothetical protein